MWENKTDKPTDKCTDGRTNAADRPNHMTTEECQTYIYVLYWIQSRLQWSLFCKQNNQTSTQEPVTVSATDVFAHVCSLAE